MRHMLVLSVNGRAICIRVHVCGCVVTYCILRVVYTQCVHIPPTAHGISLLPVGSDQCELACSGGGDGSRKTGPPWLPDLPGPRAAPAPAEHGATRRRTRGKRRPPRRSARACQARAACPRPATATCWANAVPTHACWARRRWRPGRGRLRLLPELMRFGLAQTQRPPVWAARAL